jgi:hypothetical protein
LEVLELVLAAFAGLLALGSLGGSLALVGLGRRFRRQAVAGVAAVRPDFAPRVALHIPTRGDPALLEPNLRALLAQEYAPLEVVLTLDTRSEPLFALCHRLAAEVAPGRATVVAVEDEPAPATASGKCAAQLRGLAAISPEAEVLVFADDDIRPDPLWLKRLVAPLADREVGVATAYRWYLAPRGSPASHIRAAWNLVGLQIMFSDKWNFAWGGGMALRRDEFEAWKVAEGWQRAVSDDYVVTITAKRLQRAIRFVPSALAPAYEGVEWPAMLEFCRRQTFMTRIYDPGLWKFAVAPYLFFNGLLFLGAGVLTGAALGVPLPPWALVAAAVFVLHVPLNLLKAAVYYRAVGAMLEAHQAELKARRAGYLAGAALAPFVMIYALFKTRRLTHIVWRGRRYEVNGPMDVRPL